MPRIFGPIVKPAVSFSTTKLANVGRLPSADSVRASSVTPNDMSVPALEMNVLRPLISQPPSRAHGPRADAARVRTRVGLGQTERAERASLGQRPQPALALRVVAEEVERQRTDGHVRLPRGGHRLVGQADLLHRGDEADRRHADAAPLLGDQHAEQAQRAHLAEQVGRAPRLLPRRRRARRDLLLRELAAQADQVAFRLGEREVHGRILLDRPVQRLLSIRT